MLALGASIICDWVMYENDAKQALPLQCEELRFEARELIGADAAGSKERGCRNRRIDAHQGDLPSYSGIGKDRASIVAAHPGPRSEEHTSELQSLMRISYAVFCLKKKKHT